MPASTHLKYGGNTTCIEVEAAGETFILDGGTGIRNLGLEMVKNDELEHCHILLTHTHWDHINGFPFFTPAYIPGRKFVIMAGHLKEAGGIERVFDAQMEQPVFPVPLGAMESNLEFLDFRSGEDLDISLSSNVKVTTAPLNHPNGATGYRIEYDGKSMCLITDTEHIPGKPDENILELIEGADLVIYDSTYTEEEFPTKVGWGHSTWEEGMKLCKMAGAKKLGIFHHDPEHDDVFMDKLAEEAERAWEGNFVIKEGMNLLVD